MYLFAKIFTVTVPDSPPLALGRGFGLRGNPCVRVDDQEKADLGVTVEAGWVGESKVARNPSLSLCNRSKETGGERERERGRVGAQQVSSWLLVM